MDLDRLDAELGGTFRVQLGESVVELPPATDYPWAHVAAMLGDPLMWAAMIWPSNMPLRWWQVEVVQRAWARHNGLPDAPQARRLLYMVQKFGNGIEFDLRNHLHGVSLGELFRGRRWRELLNLLDQLPTDTHMNRLLTTDEDYMEAVLGDAEPSKDDDEEKPQAPSMAHWSQTNAMLAALIDAVNKLNASNQALAGAKNPKFEPYPRPESAAQKIMARREEQRKRRKHEELVSLLLPKAR